ncbi:hypothetical protein [Sutcliffiella horikoshii]|uniref:hypothetical protein n=1 Tax=Sutcliffiella horikoshii TaxID=79883 RepID=UPI001F2D2115|nr:hypothetical protein [Sutcliffiella horikoshii]MCG1021456.1 hypothetical protein [Sutcliffiella horikoshii]
MSLGEMFIKNKGEALNINGSQVVMSKRFEVKLGQDIKIEFISCRNEYRQGIELSLDKRKGYIEINSQRIKSPVFWQDSAPSSFIIKCFPHNQVGQLNLWNIWDFDGGVEAWVGNAGIIVEQEDDNNFLFRCSNGIGDIDFNDLVFRLTVIY